MKNTASIDVMLLLEGTYPYVRGGVSSWVHQLITGLSEVTFGVVFIGSEKSAYGPFRYELPDNLVHYEEHFLMDAWRGARSAPTKGHDPAFVLNEEMHRQFKSDDPEQAGNMLAAATRLLMQRKGISRPDFLYSRAAWEKIRQDYQRYCTDPSFIDYFWTVRTMHMPLFDLARIANNMPEARLLHSVSTGYAGCLGALAHQKRHLPLLLTEHGNYTKERRIDLAQARWIRDTTQLQAGTIESSASHARQLWIRFFEGLGKMTYHAATSIIALYAGNSRQQQRDGAHPSRCRIIPNGIHLDAFRPIRVRRSRQVPPVLGLFGRVVSIKDIKTFIRAMTTVCKHRPDAQGWIIGPTEEDEDYVAECRQLVKNLDLETRIRFLGFRQVTEIMPQLGVLILSSISEAQPLAVLEAFATGIPAVTTDVGCCSELIFGTGREDRKLGPAGAVVPIARPALLARAALTLLDDPDKWRQAHDAAIQRVERYYDATLVYQRYRSLYADIGGLDNTRADLVSASGCGES